MDHDSPYGQVITLPTRTTQAVRAGRTLGSRPALTDVHPGGIADASATGFVVSQLCNGMQGPILWVQDRASGRENGRLYTPGLRTLNIDHAILQVTVSHPQDVLWAMEEGAACAGLSAVVGEIHGAPTVLDFTATKRLAMRADASGVSVYLIRSGDPGGSSAARERWRVKALPSQRHPYDSQSPGLLQWDIDLFRARGCAPGRWVAQYDQTANEKANRLRLFPRLDDGTVDAGDQPVSDRAGS